MGLPLPGRGPCDKNLPRMSRRKQLVVIIVAVLLITSALNHLIARQFKIFSKAGERLEFGNPDEKRLGFAAGSSLTFYGIAWKDVAESLGQKLVSYAVPGGSVREMEVMFRRQPAATCTFIGISAYDINEHHISNFRAQLVPFTEEVGNLWAVRADWAYSKKVLSQYPMQYVRVIFPTAGQYGAVMVKLREILRAIFHTRTEPQKPSSEGAVITDKGNSQTSTIADWTPAHMERTIADIRSHAGGVFEFHSTKRASLFRFIHAAEAQGKVVVLVMPESPVYNAEFLTEEVRHRFDTLLADAQKESPSAVWVRLDQAPELNSNQYFWDLVHMNAAGQAIGTKILLAKLAAAGITK